MKHSNEGEFSATPDAVVLNAKFVNPHKAMPTIALRRCRTTDSKRVIGAWMLYTDVNNMYPLGDGWSPPATPLPAPYEVRPVEGKGRGMIATRNIKRGETIVRERPIIIAPRLLLGKAGNPWILMDRGLLQLLYWLEQEDREKVVQLHNCTSLDKCGPLTGVLMTNKIGIEFADSRVCTDYSAICMDMSSVNHSCAPNAFYTFNQADITVALKASRDIYASEEITISYLKEQLTRSRRQTELKKRYDFTCACEACSSSDGAASDARRAFIHTICDLLDVMWLNWNNCPMKDTNAWTKKDIKIMHKVLDAMDEENLHDRRQEICQHLALLYSSLCDVDNFRKWAKECVKEFKAIKGKEAAFLARRWEGWMNEPSSLAMWGSALSA